MNLLSRRESLLTIGAVAATLAIGATAQASPLKKGTLVRHRKTGLLYVGSSFAGELLCGGVPREFSNATASCEAYDRDLDHPCCTWIPLAELEIYNPENGGDDVRKATLRNGQTIYWIPTETQVKYENIFDPHTFKVVNRRCLVTKRQTVYVEPNGSIRAYHLGPTIADSNEKNIAAWTRAFFIKRSGPPTVVELYN